MSGTANNKATLGPITVTEEDAFGNAINATNPVTVTLGSTSTGATFATTSGGAVVGSVTIPANQSSATFYYGDTVAGAPTVTASASGLAPSHPDGDHYCGHGQADRIHFERLHRRRLEPLQPITL